jgi:WD40 repeat protein/serine/threonine protein kinase/DNA-binding SARP family transcriptional activator
MARLSARLLGSLEVRLDGEPVTAFESDKVRALLAFLIEESDRPHPREKLAEFLWPERPATTALSNLRHALTVLRRAIGDTRASPYFLNVSRQAIRFNRESDAWADVFDLKAASLEPPDSQEEFAVLEAAASLVRGAFLEGLSAGDSPALEDWLLLRRSQYGDWALQALGQLASYAEVAGEIDSALQLARRQLEIAPWHEAAHRKIMRLLALSGRRGAALNQFETCRRVLADELEAGPAPETLALYESIRAGEIKPLLSETFRPYIRGYELGEKLGEGNAAVVYRAYQPVVARDVAVKIILPQFASRPAFIRRFEMEARVVASLEHPHIVPLYDFWREPGGAYLVMRWMRGGSLASLLSAGPLPAEQCLSIVEQVSAALAAGHRRQIVHCDVRPANILLDEEGNAYLSDFGVASTIGPAMDWQACSAADTTSSLGYLSPEVAQGGSVTPAADIYSLGVVIYELLAGRHPFPGLSPEALIQMHLKHQLPSVLGLRPELPPAVDEIIEQATAKQPGDRFEDCPAVARALRRALLAHVPLPVLPAEEQEPLHNPYKGLEPYQEADAAAFFGREALVQRLLDRMNETDEGRRFLAVVGPSGSGKSSVIQAGLLPALRAGGVTGSENWYVIQLVPGARPLAELALALLGVASRDLPELDDCLRRDVRTLATVANTLLPDDTSELLLIVDQLEAIYTGSTGATERGMFLQQLYNAAIEPHSRLRVLMVLRADFYDRPLAEPGLSQLMGRRTETVCPLTADEVARAIEGPARQLDVEPEPGLASRIVADVMEQGGALPMLQYALTELFERRRGRWLTHDAYQEIGGLSGALVQRAEDLFLGLSPDEQRAARQLFLRLVATGDDEGNGTRSPAVRRILVRSDLRLLTRTKRSSDDGPAAASPSKSLALDLQPVLESFGRARLLTFDRDVSTREPTVEVAHEALLREWPRLRLWIDESRDQLRLQRLLGQAASAWLTAKRDPDYLLRGTRLVQFESWESRTDLALTDSERKFLEASLDRREKGRAAELARRAYEAALEQRSRRFFRLLTGVLAVATLATLLLALYAFGQRRGALVAYSLSLTANAQQALSGRDTATALLLALAANRIDDPPLEAKRTLLQAAYSPGARQRYEAGSLLPGLDGRTTDLSISPDGRLALVGFANGAIGLLDWQAGVERGRLIGHADRVNAVVFAPDGQTALSAADDGLVLQWDLSTGQIRQKLVGHSGAVRTVDASQDGRLAVSGGFAGTSYARPGELILWDLETGREMKRFEGHLSGLVQARFTMGDSAILASSGDAELLTDRGDEGDARQVAVDLLLWDVTAGTATSFPAIEHDVASMAVSPDGKQALLGSFYNNVALLVDLASGATLLTLDGHSDAVSAVAFSGDGRRCLTGSRDGSLILWNLDSGEALVNFRVHRAPVTGLTLSPDSRTALSITRDGELIQWDLHDAAEIARFVGHGDMVYDVAFLPDGERFLSVSGGASPGAPSSDTTVRLWRLDTGEQLRVLEVPTPVLFQVSVTPDGRTALVASMLSDVLVLDVDTLAEIGRLVGHRGWVTAVELSPDGRQALTASVDGALILWDLESRQRIQRFETGAIGGLWSVAISPDGHSALSDTDEGVVAWWDLASGKALGVFRQPGLASGGGSSGIVYLPDGRGALTGSNDGSLLLWDLSSGHSTSIGQHNDIRTRVELSPDGRLALTSGMDGMLMLWDVARGELIRRFGMPGQMIFDVDMSADGLTALSGLSDASIVLWRLDNPSVQELTAWIEANRALRDLGCEERELYQIGPLCP